MEEDKIKYTESILYEVFLTGKYIKKMGEQLFKKIGLSLTSEEFATLDFLYENENICQRDLALAMLINRANMGKILNSLDKKGYIERKLSIKCNHPVKLVSLTIAGKKMYETTIKKLREQGENVIASIPTENIGETILNLQKIRESLKNLIEIDI